MLSRISGNKRNLSLFTNINRQFAKRYYIVNYEYTEDTFYTRSKFLFNFSPNFEI